MVRGGGGDLPAVFSGFIPIPSSVIIALVAAGTLNYRNEFIQIRMQLIIIGAV